MALFSFIFLSFVVKDPVSAYLKQSRLSSRAGLCRPLIIFGKQMLADIENAIRNEQGGKNVYGIMQMSQKHGRAAHGRTNEEKISQPFFPPKNKSRQKRQAGMGGKKQIIARTETGDVIRGVDVNFRRIRSDMRQNNEERPDEKKNRDAFQGEGNIFRFHGVHGRQKQNEKHRAFGKNDMHVHDRQIVQQNIRYGIAGMQHGVEIGVLIDEQNSSQKNHACEHARDKRFL
jgi:hypothetical protein